MPLPATHWVTSTVLLAMAERKLKKGDTFTSTDMRQWAPAFRNEASRKTAAQKLQELGFVTFSMALQDQAKTVARYKVTAEGQAALQAAALGQVRKSGPRGPHTGARVPPQPSSFVARLWALLRARITLDSETAASTLIDAGQNVAVAQKTAQRYLRRWEVAGAVQESRKRTASGCKRYVLVNDRPTAPAWTAADKTRRAKSAAKSSAHGLATGSTQGSTQ